MNAGADLEVRLRGHIYQLTLRHGRVPTVAELAAAAAASDVDVREGLARLAGARIVVQQPASGELLMVPPFSAVPTPFVVRTAPHTSYANCAWDALGVPVMMREVARIESACGCCGEALVVHTHRDAIPGGNGVIHFAVPARRWWEDVVFT